MDRRSFLKSSALAAGGVCFTGMAGWQEAFAAGRTASQVGKALKAWKKGQFQIHFIYTGVGESAFYIFPDGTTMLLDCGDFDVVGRVGQRRVPLLPNSKRNAGEWVARYVERVNPNGKDVDYMFLSHYHNDHSGCSEYFKAKEIRDGKEYFLSGFALAAETLHFRKAIDRAWPDFSDPVPVDPDIDGGVLNMLKPFYDYQIRHNGLEVEKFRLGVTDQIVPLRNPSSCPDFVVRNIAGNGRIADENGHITDLFADTIEATHPTIISENAMSLGMILSYGNFKMFTCGDFSYGFERPDGSYLKIEDALAAVCPRVNVAKVNHHGHNSMTPALVKALSPRVFVSCVWNISQNKPKVMEMLDDKSIYPGQRTFCPTIMPIDKRPDDAGASWLADVEPAAFEAGHVVVTVEKGGDKYSVAYVSADDESMTVKSVLHFNSNE